MTSLFLGYMCKKPPRSDSKRQNYKSIMWHDSNCCCSIYRHGIELESKPCYISILQSQSPHKSPCKYTIHFKIELLLPFPDVHVLMNHSIPGEGSGTICSDSFLIGQMSCLGGSKYMYDNWLVYYFSESLYIIMISVSGCLLLNTGISLVCVNYEILKEGKLFPTCANSNSTQYTSHDVQHFVMPMSHTRPAGNWFIMM